MDFEEVRAAILALFPRLDETEQRVSLALYRLFARQVAVSDPDLAGAAGIAPREAERILKSWPTVQRSTDGLIIGYAGLTTAETRHRMRFDGIEAYGWCAWDTLFLPELLGVSAQVRSACAATGQDVALKVHADGVECADAAPWVSLVAPSRAAAADIQKHFCCHVHFFVDQPRGEAWVAEHPATFLATLEQAWQLGRRRNALHYAKSLA
jgi:alkylmercury lyase